jgi:uncharacterized protein (TIGR02231 family)
MPLSLEAPITQVTVFTDRARLTRNGKIQLPKGESVIVLSGITMAMESDSVRVNGKGAGITIRGVDVKSDILAESKDELKAALQAESKALKARLRELEHERAGNDAELSYYQYLQNYSGAGFGEGMVKGDIPFERVSSTIKFIREQLEEIYSRRREMEARWQETNSKLTEVANKLAFDSQLEIKRGQAVHIAVEAVDETELEISLEYLVKNAAWRPLYDIRLLENKEIELSYFAEISQTTGEDWQEVMLSLSTARPARSKLLPKASTWYIETPEDKLAEQRGAKIGAASPVFGESSRRSSLYSPAAEEAPKPKAEIQQAAIRAASSGVFVTYSIGTPLSILGNGEPHKTTVTISTLKTELDYLTVPRVAEEAYLRAKITNNSLYTILQGDASIYHGNDFIAKTALLTVAPNDDFQIHLGMDERVKVERKLLQRDSTSRFLGSVAQTEYRYLISLTNLQDEKVKITIEEAYPLGRSSHIKVSLDSVNPAAKSETDLHILTWELELAAKEKREIEIAFTIEHGRNQRIFGLDD